MSIQAIKRIAIYVVHDKDGIIDDYIPFYLSELRPCVTHLVVVCNGLLTDEGRYKLSNYADDIFVRPNIGFDCGAVKDVLFNFVGWDKIYEYDELLIANDTIYGPFCSFISIFNEMDKRKCDVWGLSLQTEGIKMKRINRESEIMPSHIQAFFINIKHNLLHSSSFYDFWHKIDPWDYNYNDVVVLYEVAFSVRFRSEGYVLDAYFDTADYFSNVTGDFFPPVFYDPLELLITYNFPFLKTKVLKQKNTKMFLKDYSHTYSSILKYIDDNTNYDVDLIRDNIIRYYRYNDLYSFCSNYQYIYVYGTGEMAQHWYDVMMSNNISLPNINGFVVSDGHRKVEELFGYKVLHLSEIPYSRDIGFILALNPENTSEVKNTLEEKGYHNIFQL